MRSIESIFGPKTIHADAARLRNWECNVDGFEEIAKSRKLLMPTELPKDCVNYDTLPAFRGNLLDTIPKHLLSPLEYFPCEETITKDFEFKVLNSEGRISYAFRALELEDGKQTVLSNWLAYGVRSSLRLSEVQVAAGYSSPDPGEHRMEIRSASFCDWNGLKLPSLERYRGITDISSRLSTISFDPNRSSIGESSALPFYGEIPSVFYLPGYRDINSVCMLYGPYYRNAFQSDFFQAFLNYFPEQILEGLNKRAADYGVGKFSLEMVSDGASKLLLPKESHESIFTFA